jgi:hypothetical protein
MPVQLEFLRSVAPPETAILEAGFPFHPEFDHPSESALIAASVRNALQYLWSRHSPGYQRLVTKALQPLFDNTSHKLVIITGSCGLQILHSAWPSIVKPANLNVRIIAVGPAGPPMPEAITLQGTRDFWSKILYRGPVAVRCNTGHLDYWSSPEVRRIVVQLLSCESPS